MVERQRELESSSPVRFAFHPNASAVRLDDQPAKGQPQTTAVFLRRAGDKCLKQAALNFDRDTRTVVTHADHERMACGLFVNRYPNKAALVNELDRIAD